jgi:hypothetical protein
VPLKGSDSSLLAKELTVGSSPYEESARYRDFIGMEDAVILGPGFARHPLGLAPSGPSEKDNVTEGSYRIDQS